MSNKLDKRMNDIWRTLWGQNFASTSEIIRPNMMIMHDKYLLVRSLLDAGYIREGKRS
jgi:hypothetical protein